MHIPILKVDVAVPRRKWKNLIYSVETFGKFHPEEYRGRNKATLSNEEIKLRSDARRIVSFISEIESYFGEVPEIEGEGKMDLEAVRKAKEGLMGFVRDIHSFEQEKMRLEDYLEIAGIVEGRREEGKHIIPIVLGRGESGSKEILVKGLANFKVEHEEISLKDRILILVKSPESIKGEVMKFIEENAFPVVKPPKGYESLEEIKLTLTERIPLALADLRKEAQASFEGVKALLSRQKYVAKETLFYLNSKEKFLAFSKFLVSIKGWIPWNLKEEFKEHILGAERDAVIEFKEPARYEYENVPVALKNYPPVSYFQSFLDIYSPPVYKTVDPSVFIALFFPVYYGFMLGDAGYGIVGIFLFWMLSNAFKKGSVGYNLSMAYFINSVFATIFGIIFGEIFGDFGVKMGIIQPLFHRTHEVIDLILIAVGFGFLQMFMGMLLGVYNYWILEHKKHSMFELGRFFAILGTLISLLVYVDLPGISPEWARNVPAVAGYTGMGFLILGVILSILAEGPLGVIEIFSAFGNVLSYARLAAVGLASAILAEIANKFIELIPLPPFAVLVALIFHALAFVLGIIDPTIQGMRLQFVEFFTKFYVPANRIFNPLRKGGSI